MLNVPFKHSVHPLIQLCSSESDIKPQKTQNEYAQKAQKNAGIATVNI